jgi:hypothetical protein
MRQAQKLSESFRGTLWIIDKQTEGITHEQSLLQLPFRANCMNWVIGHLLISRGRVLEALGDSEPAIANEHEMVLYDRSSDPVTEADKATDFDDLMARFRASQARIEKALSQVHQEEWDTLRNPEREMTLGDWIAFLHWHETYHTGQLEILRQLAGKHDVIVA